MERQLIRDYELIIDEVLGALTPDNHALAVQIACIPEEIRGFGHVKERHLKAAKDKEASLLAVLRTPAAMPSAA
jgi:indolepyruvate ferredoxin oxidoreductase